MKILVACLLPGFYPALVCTAGNFCCAQLEKVLPDKLHYPGDQVYNASLSSFWSEQEQSVTPICVLRPVSGRDVSEIIRTLATAPKCRFAVKSGGHMAQAGAANIEDGVTIDLSALAQFSFEQGRSRVTLGPGLRWGEVYNKLAAYGLAVPGGRSSDVGVGGYLLGGGLGYFIPYGFGCDNIVAYKVVVASGAIQNVDAVTHPELFRALKGGSNNFGIVVSFTLRTFPLGRVWGGNMVYLAAPTVDQQLKAFSDFTGNTHYDVHATVQMSISFAPSVGIIFVDQPFYALPRINPPALRSFTRIRPRLQDQTSLTTLTAFANASGQLSPLGFRQMTWSLSVANDLETLHALFIAFNNSIPSIASVAGIAWSITLEPLPTAFLLSSAKFGGNSLGLPIRPRGKALVLCDSSFTWINENDTATVRNAGLKLLDDIIRSARQLGTYNDWVDLNHADYSQDPISSYGRANGAFMRYVSRRYDPGQTFQKQLPGGFKLPA
ncbi:FAD binding domain protein [Lentithecium fluviatile CBS 122367]|uniref:FAD binding domain protein n=1 Tax=Lentithecium fluviatile CBS 122367 TaxID=1168545 RepID=A0A6G1ICN5_9PLEO|nr:FAD binding domain protein [Lentithecium fluviatile CBS 122367]